MWLGAFQMFIRHVCSRQCMMLLFVLVMVGLAKCG